MQRKAVPINDNKKADSKEKISTKRWFI